jgi:hypothetical protein
MHSHFTMIFPSFHFTTHTHPSHPRHSLLPFTSPSLHFTSLLDDFPHTFTSPYLSLSWLFNEAVKSHALAFYISQFSKLSNFQNFVFLNHR